MACTQRKRRGGGRGKGKGKKHTPKNHYGIVNEITAITNGLGSMSVSGVRPASASASAPPSASRGPKSVQRSVYNPLGRQTRTGRVPKVPATIRENVEEAVKRIENAKGREAQRKANNELVKLFGELK
jgi:hypothetical protein